MRADVALVGWEGDYALGEVADGVVGGHGGEAWYIGFGVRV